MFDQLYSRTEREEEKGYGRSGTMENPVAGRKYPSREKMHKARSLPKESKRILKQWLIDNFRKPFASEEEKKRLAAATNLTTVQVSNWLINGRRRYLPDILRKHGLKIEDVLKKRMPKVKIKSQGDKKSKFQNKRLPNFNITNENRADRKDPGKGCAMPLHSSQSLGKESCPCKECVDRKVKKPLRSGNAENEFYGYASRNLLMLAYCSDNLFQEYASRNFFTLIFCSDSISRFREEARQNFSDSNQSPAGSE